MVSHEAEFSKQFASVLILKYIAQADSDIVFYSIRRRRDFV